MRALGPIVSLLAASLLVVVACGVDDLNLAGKGCPCTSGWVCDTANNRCVQLTYTPPPDASVDDDAGAGCVGKGCACTVDADCVDPDYHLCVGGKCDQCKTTQDCPDTNKQYCANNECVSGCEIDAQCVALGTGKFCNTTRHQCVECLVNGDCGGGGKACSPSGACVATCTNSCPSGGECCGGLCIDTTKDVLNCGTCGKACAANETLCCAGTCADPLKDLNNCGACGTKCTANNGTPTCSGTCGYTCNAGYAHCQGDNGCATNLTNDTRHCGSCYKDCNESVHAANGIKCAASTCDYDTCKAPYVDANSKRSDGCEANTDPTCGANGQPCCVGNLCNSNSKCSNGTCVPD
jgi:hypothetical protein